MRTTLSLDSALYAAVRTRAHQSHASVGGVIQALLRQALADQDVAPAVPFRLHTIRSGIRPGLTVEQAQHRVDDEVDAAQVAGLRTTP
jgi:hypothetical protein